MAVITLVEFCLMRASNSQILFVEGNSSTSWDAKIYNCIFPACTVVPVGSAGLVIKYVHEARKNRPDIQDRIHGLIDRDRRSLDDVDILKEQGIFVLQVAEVENLFCTSEVIERMCFERGLTALETVESIRHQAFALLRDRATEQISIRVREKLKLTLAKYQNVSGKEALADELERVTSSIALDEVYTSYEQEYEAVIDSGDYRTLLAYFNDKSLKDVVAKHFSLRGSAYLHTVIELATLSQATQQHLRQALSHYLGGL